MRNFPHTNQQSLKYNKMVNEADIKLVIGDLESQKKPNFTQIANKYNLHRTTLKRQFNGETTSYH